MAHHFDALQDPQGNLNDENLNSLDAGCNPHPVPSKLFMNVEPGSFVSSTAFEIFPGAIDQPVPPSLANGVIYLTPGGPPTLTIAAGPFPVGEHMPLATFKSDTVQVTELVDVRPMVGTSVIGGGPPSGVAGGVLAGTYPAPAFAAGAIVNADVNAGAAIAESKLALNNPTHSAANDPTADEKAALAGTSGAPAAGNPYVTNADARNADARTPTAHAAVHKNGGGDEVATATPGANEIPKALGSGKLDNGWINRQVRGDDRQNLVAEARTTTILASPGAAKLQLLTGALTGTYRIDFQADFDNNGALFAGTVRLQKTTAAPATLDQADYDELITVAGARRWSGFVEIVLAGVSQTIEIQHFDNAGGNTQGIQRARIEFFRVA